MEKPPLPPNSPMGSGRPNIGFCVPPTCGGTYPQQGPNSKLEAPPGYMSMGGSNSAQQPHGNEPAQEHPSADGTAPPPSIDNSTFDDLTRRFEELKKRQG